MADCGPSNPLAQFKQQTNIDRSLQNDRITSRPSPAQGFRTQDPNAGVLDPEFEAFQAGVPTGDLQQYGGQFLQSQQSPYLFTGPTNTSWGQAPGPVAQSDVGWANDFQQLQISGPQLQQQQQFPVQADDNLTANWAQGFRQHVQQQPTQRPLNNGSPSPLQFQQRARMGMGMGMSGYRPQFQSYFSGQASDPAPNVQQQGKGKQPAYEAFDDVAFEAAFSQARSEMMEESTAVEAPQAQGRTSHGLMQPNEDLLQHFNAALRKEFAQDPTVAPVNAFQKQLEKQKASGMASRQEIPEDEVQEHIDTLKRSMRTAVANGSAQEATREEMGLAPRTMAEWEELKMDTYARGPGGAWEAARLQAEREALEADRERGVSSDTPHGIDYDEEQGENGDYEDLMRMEALMKESHAKEEEQRAKAESDALAATAQELLSKVEDNKSDKFRNSQFLTLMRKLRDREVKVEGDKMVENVSTSFLKPAAVLHEDSGYGSSGATTPRKEERRGDGGHFDTHICQHPGCDIDHVYDHWESPVGTADATTLNTTSQNMSPMFDNSEQRPSPLVGQPVGLVDTRPLDYGIGNNDDSDIGRIDPRDGQGVRDLLDVGNLGGGTVMADEIGTSPSSPSDAGVFENVGQEGPFYGDLRTLHGARSSEGVSVSEMLYGHDGTLSRPVQWAEREDVVAGSLTREETVERVKDTVDAMMFAGARRNN
ncbi:hypothetical protein LTR56_022608 [Elasticomyces elasticus]|nr:hypothetical protein LTR56_022608 [Elasticomyces elasticus]KAK3628425.1 hypothetical protein LTR22_022386 [Elasticomyces elasticus]KAK4907819.1 hypothetical protein LTR49_023217 [Elasticomyces elasticus]KAK5747982.1 hypothetical protein LTS12_021978 [Elasticomyces elasticus]